MNRIISLSLVICIVLSGIFIMPTALAAEEGSSLEFEMIKSLKLTEDFGELKTNDTIMRGEFFAIMAGILSNRSKVQNLNINFADEAEYPLINRVKYMLQNGYINLDKEGKLRLFEPIKLNDAITIIIDVLGYKNFVEQMGGYHLVANNLDITSGVLATNDGELTWRYASKLIYNSLTAPKFGQTVYGTDSNYEKISETLLDNMELTKVEGVVIKTRYTDKASELKATSVVMNYSYKERTSGGKTINHTKKQATFDFEDNKIISYLGQRVIAFVRDIDEENKFIECAMPYKNNITRIENDKYVRFSDSSLVFEYSPNKDNNINKLSFSKDTIINQNGIIITSDATPPNKAMLEIFKWEKMKRQYGFFTLIDNTGDDVIDYVFVEQYQDYFVSNVALDKDTVRLDDGLEKKPIYTINKDLIGDGVNIIYQQGNRCDIKDLAKNDVISVMVGDYEQVDSNLKALLRGTIVVSKDTITGTITEVIPSDDTKGELKVNGEYTYKYVVMDPAKPKNFTPYAGDEGKLYTNFVRKIIYKDVRSSYSTEYGLLYMLYGDSNIGDTTLQAKLFTSRGKCQVYDFAQRVLMRNNSNTNGEKISYKRSDLKKVLLNNEKTKTDIGIITYVLNKDNEISDIAFSMNNVDKAVNKYNVTLDRIINEPQQDGTIKNAASFNKGVLSFGDSYISPAAPIFNISKKDGTVPILDPITKKFAANLKLEENEVSVFKASSLSDKANPYLLGYGLVDGNELTCVITVGNVVKAQNYESLGVITNVSKTVVDEEEMTKIKFIQNASEQEAVIASDATINNRYSGVTFGQILPLQKGDIFEYSKDAGGKIDSLALVFRPSVINSLKPSIKVADGVPVPQDDVCYYNDISDSSNTAKYYFGLATEKTVYSHFSKLAVNLDDATLPTDYNGKLKKISFIALNSKTNIYSYSKIAGKVIKKIDFLDIIVDLDRGGASNIGNLVFVKTVNGLATDIIALEQ